MSIVTLTAERTSEIILGLARNSTETLIEMLEHRRHNLHLMQQMAEAEALVDRERTMLRCVKAALALRRDVEQD